MAMKNPPHPGGVVRRQCIEPLRLTITDAAAALGVTRTSLSELVNGRRGISPEMATNCSPPMTRVSAYAGPTFAGRSQQATVRNSRA